MFDNTFFLLNKVNKKEQLKLHKQKECVHNLWNTRCAVCEKILGSDSIRNIESDVVFVNDNHLNEPTPIKTSFGSKSSKYKVEVLNLTEEEQTPLETIVYKHADVYVLNGQVKVTFSNTQSSFKEFELKSGGMYRLRNLQTFILTAKKSPATLLLIKLEK